MKTHGWITLSALSLVSVAGLGGLALVPAAAPAPAPLEADAYAVDSAHSFVVFKIKHQGVGNAYGMFVNPTGTFTIDPADHTKSTIEVSVKADGVNTGNAKRDQHLKSADFFSVKEFEEITFKSTAMKAAGDAMEITGDLTLHGVTKPVTATATVIGTGTGRGGAPMMGVEATFTIKRTDFGMSTMVGEKGLADEVMLTVALEGAKR